MDEYDRLGWIKFLSLYSIIIGACSLLYTAYYVFGVFQSPLLGIALALSAFLCGLTAVILDIKYDLQDCAAALLGIVFSALPLILFLVIHKFFFWVNESQS